MQYIPYTYLIGWSNLDRWYYGSEYKNNKWTNKTANPENLWNTYFTSSKIVKEYRKLYGEPDIIKVRKIFNSAEKTRKWESKVLHKLNASSKEKWLNKNNCCAPDISGNNNPSKRPEVKEKQRIAALGKKRFDMMGENNPAKRSDVRKKISIAKKGIKLNNTNVYICPHCNKNGTTNAMKQWHFDRCKFASTLTEFGP